MDGKMTLEQVVKFLLGEGEIDGVWFGEKPSGERGNYWWRKHLREAKAHLTQPAQSVDVEKVKEVIADLTPETWGSPISLSGSQKLHALRNMLTAALQEKGNG